MTQTKRTRKAAKNDLLAWCETQILTERLQMIDPVDRDEQQENSGMTEAYYDELDERAAEVAEERMSHTGYVSDGSDYPLFFCQLMMALVADSNHDRLHWLAAIRDNVHARIKSTAREELRKADLEGEEP